MKKFLQKIRQKFQRKNTYSISDEDYEGEGEEIIFSSEEILARTENIRRGYIFWFYLTILIIFSALFIKLWILQVIQGDYNKSLAEGNRIRTRNIISSRGLIYDRQKNILARNIPDFTLVIYPADLSKKTEEREELYRQVSEMTGLSFEEIKNKTEPNSGNYLESIVLKESLAHEEALILEEKTSAIKGVVIEKRSTRGYVLDLSLAHILGYVGDINQEEYESSTGYRLNDKIGKAGVEKYYESELKGIDGKEQIEVDSGGRLQKIIAKKDPKAGKNLILSIDSDLQRVTRQILTEQLNGQGLKKGAAVISNPNNGEILAIVSEPSYDNNIFSTPQLKDVYSGLIANPDQPLFNRTISGVYPSGSTVKPVVAAAALQEGVVGVNDWIICKGELSVPNQYDPSIIYLYKDWKSHGGVNVTKALAESCNVFFYTVGGGFDRIKGLGVERLVKYFKLFGLGEKTGIDLDGENKGIVPDADWKQRTKNEPWVLGDTYHLAIGQGDLVVTPLQVNSYTVAIANGGRLLKPHLAMEIVEAKSGQSSPVKAEIIRENFVSPETIVSVRAGMRACVTAGSCDKLASLPVSSGGKTGTAQSGRPNEKEHGWFTAFAPYENPQIAITVLIENGGEGYVSAEPVAQRILQYYFSR